MALSRLAGVLKDSRTRRPDDGSPTSPPRDSSVAVAALVKSEGIDFLDFGCSVGGSLKLGTERLGGTKGLGIDIDEKKIKKAREAGYLAVHADINHIPDEKVVRFTVMSHFLEHVPGRGDVRNFVKKACHISKKFVLIKQPYFDADGSLLRMGLKFNWSDWRVHPNRMTSLELVLLLRDLLEEGLLGRFTVHLKDELPANTNYPRIHPISCPPNQQEYDSDIHPHKPLDTPLPFPIFKETVAMISMKGTPHVTEYPRWQAGTCIFDSRDHF